MWRGLGPGVAARRRGDLGQPQPHQSEEAIEAVEAAGARVLPLPPWSPDLTPIEEMFSKVKEALRSAGTDRGRRLSGVVSACMT